MIGGPEAFGAGGWTNSKLEEAMPVNFSIKNSKVKSRRCFGDGHACFGMPKATIGKR